MQKVLRYAIETFSNTAELKTTTTAVVSSSNLLTVSDATNIAINDIIMIGNFSSPSTELKRVQSKVDNVLTLTTAITKLHTASSPVYKVAYDKFVAVEHNGDTLIEQTVQTAIDPSLSSLRLILTSQPTYSEISLKLFDSITPSSNAYTETANADNIPYLYCTLAEVKNSIIFPYTTYSDDQLYEIIETGSRTLDNALGYSLAYQTKSERVQGVVDNFYNLSIPTTVRPLISVEYAKVEVPQNATYNLQHEYIKPHTILSVPTLACSYYNGTSVAYNQLFTNFESPNIEIKHTSGLTSFTQDIKIAVQYFMKAYVDSATAFDASVSGIVKEKHYNRQVEYDTSAMSKPLVSQSHIKAMAIVKTLKNKYGSI